MGDSVSNCKRTANFVEIETSSSILPCKRAKTIGSMNTELKRPRLYANSMDKEISPAISSSRPAFAAETAGEHCSILYSDCSSNESCEIVKDGSRLVDLEGRSFETEISTCINNKLSSRETTSTSEICGDTEEMDSTAKNLPVAARDQRIRLPAGKMPSQAEIDEFFSVAEKYEQKRFAEKYNYDIVNDAPLEGRYQWFRLKP